MCWGNPAKSLALARERLTTEQWSRFEREFEVFCVVQGMVDEDITSSVGAWAKWAFFQGRRYGVGTADQRIADARYERLAIAMMDDEQEVASLERWKEGSR